MKIGETHANDGKDRDDEKTPREMLEEIHDAVVDSSSYEPRSLQEKNWTPAPDDKQGLILREVAKKQPVRSRDLADELDVTSPLTSLWRAEYVDRDLKPPYRYTLTDVGEELVGSWDEMNMVNITLGNDRKPWDESVFTEREYLAIQVIIEADDSPTTTEVSEQYNELRGINPDSVTTPLSSVLFDLKEKGYVDRTGVEPYRYWVTEKGRDEYSALAKLED